MTKVERETLVRVADWIKEEYRLQCMIPHKTPNTEDALKSTGMRFALADLEFGLRRWAESGKPPAHQKVAAEWQWAYERRVREDAEAAL